jgi:fluoride exporter
VVRSALIGAAGAVGALARYHLQGLVHRLYAGAFPLGTFVVNISGCFLLGLLFSALTERFTVSGDLRGALTVGFLGAYTTFSTFALETVGLGEAEKVGLAVLNVALSAGGRARRSADRDDAGPVAVTGRRCARGSPWFGAAGRR